MCVAGRIMSFFFVFVALVSLERKCMNGDYDLIVFFGRFWR